MKTTIFLLLQVLLLSSFPLSAQVPLTTTTNTLRHGDILCKVEVPYVEAGDRVYGDCLSQTTAINTKNGTSSQK